MKKERPKSKWDLGRIKGKNMYYTVCKDYYESETVYHQRSKLEICFHQVALSKQSIELYIEKVEAERIRNYKENILK